MADAFDILLMNAAAAAVMAVLAALVSYGWRRPAVTHRLWLVLLLKFVTPPLVHVPVPWLSVREVPADDSAPSLPNTNMDHVGDGAGDPMQWDETTSADSAPSADVPVIPIDRDLSPPGWETDPQANGSLWLRLGW